MSKVLRVRNNHVMG